MQRHLSLCNGYRTIFKAKLFKSLTSTLIACVLLTGFPLTPVLGQSKKSHAPKIGKIFMVSPKSSNVVASGGSITLRYNVNDADITSVKINVTNGIDAASGPAGLNGARVFLYPGENTINLFGFKGSVLDSEARATINVECNTDCIAGAPPAGGMVQPTSTPTPATPAPAASPTPSPSPTASPSPSPTGGAKNIELWLPTSPVDGPTVDPTIILREKSGITNLLVDVFHKGQRISSFTVPTIAYRNGLSVIHPKLKIAKGDNDVVAFDPAHRGQQGYEETGRLTCTGDNCVEAKLVSQSGTSTQAADELAIVKPEKPSQVNAATIDMYLKGPEAIENVKYEVFNGENHFVSDAIDLKAKIKNEAPIPVSIIKGKNTVLFFNAADPKNPKHRAAIEITCEENCAADFNIVKYPGISQNSRSIVGFEQAGGSSAGSETKPFVDFFFLTPFYFGRKKDCEKGAPVGRKETEEETEQREKENRKCLVKEAQRRLLPRIGFWGDVRLASTPDQVAAAQVFPTSLVNRVTDSTKSVDLVQSFDFLAGVEGRIATADESFLGVIPGIRQKTSMYIAFGAGAISPLTARRDSIQIFNIPAVGDPRRDEFLARYVSPPGLPAGKEFIALGPVDRDRFLHQWYLGLRLKTYYCDNAECSRLKNFFPAIVDFMWGQNEAVTGGSRHRGGTPDPNNPEKLIGQRNSYIFRIDGFHPFPIKEASFLYFYGTALMKIGGGGVKIRTPLFLDNPGTTVPISDTRVYIPPTNILKLQQPDRDYYKIGIGIDLVELFNRNKRSQ